MYNAFYHTYFVLKVKLYQKISNNINFKRMLSSIIKCIIKIRKAVVCYFYNLRKIVIKFNEQSLFNLVVQFNLH